MEYNFVKDSEGFVYKKLESEVAPDEKIISEKEFGHGGKREGAGRKQKFKQPLEYQIRVPAEEKAFIAYDREKNFDYGKAMSD